MNEGRERLRQVMSKRYMEYRMRMEYIRSHLRWRRF